MMITFNAPRVNPRGVFYVSVWAFDHPMSGPAYVPQRASYACFR